MASSDGVLRLVSQAWDAVTSPERTAEPNPERERSPIRKEQVRSSVAARKQLFAHDEVDEAVEHRCAADNTDVAASLKRLAPPPTVSLESIVERLDAIRLAQSATDSRLEDGLCSIHDSIKRVREEQVALQQRLDAVVHKQSEDRALVKDVQKEAIAVQGHVQALDNAVAELHEELIATKREHCTSFVVTGLPINPPLGGVEDTTAAVKTLMAELHADATDLNNIIVAERVAQKEDHLRTARVSAGRSKPSVVRVRTSSAATCRRLLRLRTQLKSMPHPRNKIYLNEDMSFMERRRRQSLVHAFQVLKERKVKCRLDRDRIIVDDGRLVLRNEAAANHFIDTLEGTKDQPSSQGSAAMDVQESHRPDQAAASRA